MTPLAGKRRRPTAGRLLGVFSFLLGPFSELKKKKKKFYELCFYDTETADFNFWKTWPVFWKAARGSFVLALGRNDVTAATCGPRYPTARFYSRHRFPEQGRRGQRPPPPGHGISVSWAGASVTSGRLPFGPSRPACGISAPRRPSRVPPCLMATGRGIAGNVKNTEKPRSLSPKPPPERAPAERAPLPWAAAGRAGVSAPALAVGRCHLAVSLPGPLPG